MLFNFDSIPLNVRCYQTSKGRFQSFPLDDCFFGAPQDKLYGRMPLESLPARPFGFHFYLGANQLELFESFARSGHRDTTKSLHIGNSCYNHGNGRDYSRITEALTRHEFPCLESLELGVWQLFSNSDFVYGNVGRIDDLAKAAPNLRKLYIYGNCELSHPLFLRDLEILHVVVDSTSGINGGSLDSRTVNNLLSSNFPRLKEFYVDLGMEDENTCYSLPESIAVSDSYPDLNYFELVGTFRLGDRQRLEDSPLFRNKSVTIHLDEMAVKEGQ